MYTKKAIQSLQDIADGNRDKVTRQMIDRLSAERLIDFEIDRGGWYVTPLGFAAVALRK